MLKSVNETLIIKQHNPLRGDIIRQPATELLKRRLYSSICSISAQKIVFVKLHNLQGRKLDVFCWFNLSIGADFRQTAVYLCRTRYSANCIVCVGDVISQSVEPLNMRRLSSNRRTSKRRRYSSICSISVQKMVFVKLHNRQGRKLDVFCWFEN